jgi:hypothetical protein
VITNKLSYQVAANIPEVHKISLTSFCFRIYLLNDSGSDQTSLDIQTWFNTDGQLTAPLNLPLGNDSDAISVRPSDTFDDILIGRNAGASAWSKFSFRDGLDAADGEQTVWATTGNFTPMTTASTFTVTYNSTTDGEGTTGARLLQFYYLDADKNLQEATHTLGSDGSDVTAFTGLGINRVAVALSGTLTYNANDITVTATSGGFGTQAIVPALGSVTQQSMFHVPIGYTGSVKSIWLNAIRLSGGSTPKIVIKAYVFSRLVSTRFEIFRAEFDTNSDNFVFYPEPVGFRLSPQDVVYFVADTDTNSTDVGVRYSLHLYQN